MIRILQRLLQSPGGKKAAANLWRQVQRKQKMTPRPNKQREAWEAMAKSARKRESRSSAMDYVESAARRKGILVDKAHPGTPKGIRERAANSFPGIKQGSRLNAYQKSELMARNSARKKKWNEYRRELGEELAYFKNRKGEF